MAMELEKQRKEEIYQRLQQVISEIAGIPKKEITLEKTLEGDLALDSLGLFEMVVQYEDYGKIKITDSELSRFYNKNTKDTITVSNTVDFLYKIAYKP